MNNSDKAQLQISLSRDFGEYDRKLITKLIISKEIEILEHVCTVLDKHWEDGSFKSMLGEEIFAPFFDNTEKMKGSFEF